MKPKEWPHFMKKESGSIYNSINILGTLFDRVTVYTETMDLSYRPQIEEDPALLWPDYKYFLADAKSEKINYDDEIKAIMEKYKIQTESEVITATLMKKDKTLKKDIEETRQLVIKGKKVTVNKMNIYIFVKMYRN